MNDPGFIYALINVSMQGLVKVGKTTRDPKGRADELSGATGVPTPFILAYSAPFQNCTEAEKMIHTILESRCERVSNNREFFKAELNEVIEAILEAKKTNENNNGTLLGPSVESSSNDETEPVSESKSPIWEEPLSLAESSYYGTGETLQDYYEALRFYKKAATLGANSAFFMIGQMYKNGEGCQKDLNTSLKYFKEGAIKNYDRCYAEMALIYQELSNLDNSIKCWDRYFNSRAFLEVGDDNEFLSKTSYLFNYIQLCIIGVHDNELIHRLKVRFSRLSDEFKRRLNASIQKYTDGFLTLIDGEDVNIGYTIPLIRLIPEFRNLVYEYKSTDKVLKNRDSFIIEGAIDSQATRLANEGDSIKAIALYITAMEYGSKIAPQRLGEIYSLAYWDGIDRDIEKAVSYLLKGIEMGNDYCYWDLSTIYDDMNDHDKAIEFAFRYFESKSYIYNDDDFISHTLRHQCTISFIKKCLSNKDSMSLDRFSSLLRSFSCETLNAIKKESTEYLDGELKSKTNGNHESEQMYLENMRQFTLYDGKSDQQILRDYRKDRREEENLYKKIRGIVQKI